MKKHIFALVVLCASFAVVQADSERRVGRALGRARTALEESSILAEDAYKKERDLLLKAVNADFTAYTKAKELTPEQLMQYQEKARIYSRIVDNPERIDKRIELYKDWKKASDALAAAKRPQRVQAPSRTRRRRRRQVTTRPPDPKKIEEAQMNLDAAHEALYSELGMGSTGLFAAARGVFKRHWRRGVTVLAALGAVYGAHEARKRGYLEPLGIPKPKPDVLTAQEQLEQMEAGLTPEERESRRGALADIKSGMCAFRKYETEEQREARERRERIAAAEIVKREKKMLGVEKWRARRAQEERLKEEHEQDTSIRDNLYDKAINGDWNAFIELGHKYEGVQMQIDVLRKIGRDDLKDLLEGITKDNEQLKNLPDRLHALIYKRQKGRTIPTRTEDLIPGMKEK